MALPVNFNTGTVKAQYMDLTGAPITGSVTFVASPDRIVDAAALMVIIPVPLSRILDGTGSMTINLPATNDTDITPVGFTYQVIEGFPGGKTYSIPVPVGSVTDLSTVVEVFPNSGVANIIGAGVPSGGTAGQVLAKASNASYDDTWIDPPAGGPGGTPSAHAATHKGGGSDVIANATQSLAGLESSADKSKLDGIASGATVNAGAGTVTNTTVAALAGIDYSKLNLAGLIASSDISASGIAYAKLVLGNSIIASDLTAGAVTNAKIADGAVGLTKLSATNAASATTFLRGDNTWATPTTTSGVSSVDYSGTATTGPVTIPRDATGATAATSALRKVDGSAGSALPYQSSIGFGSVVIGLNSANGVVAGLPIGTAGKVLAVDSSAGGVGGINWIDPGTLSANYTGHPIIVAATSAHASVKALATASGGGVCDGVDDQVQIQAALDASAAGGTTTFGRPVLLTAGLFTVNTAVHPTISTWRAALTMTQGTTLRGSGMGRTTVKLVNNAFGIAADNGTSSTTANNCYMLTNSTGNSGSFTETNITVADITFDGNSVNQNGSNNKHCHGIVWWECSNTSHDRVRVYNMKGTSGAGQGETFGFDIKGGAYAFYNECQADANRTAFGINGSSATGFSSNQGTFIHYQGCRAFGMTGQGFTLFEASGVTYSQCMAQSNVGTGFNCEGSRDVVYQSCIAGGSSSIDPGMGAAHPYGTDVGFGNDSYGINFTDATTADGTFHNDGWMIVGCHVSRNGGGTGGVGGIKVNGAVNGKIIGTTVRRNTGNAIAFLGAGQTTNQITDCLVEGNIEIWPGYTKVGGGLEPNISQNGVNSPPATAGTGVAVASPFPFDCTVYITGGYLVTNGVQLVDRNGATTTVASQSPGTTYLGAWSAGTAYTAYQIVTSGLLPWVAVASSTGVTPGTDATKWQMITPQGCSFRVPHGYSVKPWYTGTLTWVWVPTP